MPYQLPGAKALLWTDPQNVEPQALQQIRNVASMPFIHRHVAVMPDCHFGRGATVGTVIPAVGAVIPAAVGVDIGCFHGNTRVPLLDGTQRTLRELTEAAGRFWVYSIDQGTGRIVPGRARALKTRDDASLVRVVVSGGDEIVCTPDHQFMLVDGSWRRADALAYNDSLMPLYRRWQTRDGYESISTGKGQQRMTHAMVDEHLHGPLPEGSIVHHVNHNHFDNRPENLGRMTASEHSRHHRATGHTFANSDPEFQAARREGIRRRAEDPEQRTQMAEVGTANITRYMREQPEHFRAASAGNGERGAPYLRQFNTTPRTCSDCDHEAKNPTALRWHKSREHPCNHKVISVVTLEERSEVYCLQVEEHHNFALAAGVFVHNCGMIAEPTSLTREDLPRDLEPLRAGIERRIPLGPGRQSKTITGSAARRVQQLMEDITPNAEALQQLWIPQLGSLGGGNHFIEVTLDELDRVWLFLHSGSRGVGNKLATKHTRIAARLCERWHIKLPDPDLAYLPLGTDEFGDYMADLDWAQRYATRNREEMMDRVSRAVFEEVGAFYRPEPRIQCHHNFTAWEKWDGQNVIVSRKGAIEAKEGQPGLIPGSMGTASYVVEGLGSRAAFNSAPHGAGRRMSRAQARKTFTMEDFDREMAHVTIKRSPSFLDEMPGAYKDIDQVMLDAAELVRPLHTLRQVVNVKG